MNSFKKFKLKMCFFIWSSVFFSLPELTIESKVFDKKNTSVFSKKKGTEKRTFLYLLDEVLKIASNHLQGELLIKKNKWNLYGSFVCNK